MNVTAVMMNNRPSMSTNRMPDAADYSTASPSIGTPSSTDEASSKHQTATELLSGYAQAPSSVLRRRTQHAQTGSDSELGSSRDAALEHRTWEHVDGAEAVEVESQPLTLMEQLILLGLRDKQGVLNFMNDNLSYVLRGCILMELALRNRVRLGKATAQRRTFCDRVLEVVSAEPTGDSLLDETLRLVQVEPHSVATWIDLLSGETWNPLKVNFQIKQVRERIAKQLVDKGVLRTQKHNFYLFDVATHPLVDGPTKRRLVDRVCDICGGRGTLPTLRETALVSAASAGCVLDPTLANIDGFVRREQAFSRAEELLKSFVKSCLAETAAAAKHHGAPLSSAEEVVAGVLQVYCKLDTLLY